MMAAPAGPVFTGQQYHSEESSMTRIEPEKGGNSLNGRSDD